LLTLWQFFEKIFQSNEQKFSKKQQKHKQKRKEKMAKFKQVNTLLKLLHLYLHLLLSILLQKTTTERMPLCDLDPPFFAKNNKKKERNFTGFVVYRRILLQKKHTMNRKPLIMMY
jgi:hypothetical protein